MSWSERVAALPLKMLVGAAGLAGAMVGLASGTLPLVLGSYAVLIGAGVISTVAGWRKRAAHAEACRTLFGEKTREELLAEVGTMGSRLEYGPETGTGRFRERLSPAVDAGRNRLH